MISSPFTSKERDPETGLDYFAARYMSSAQGRFTSPDPLWVNADRLLDPQRLNLYAYARNNPLRYNDPTGLDVTIGHCGGDLTLTQCEAAVTNGLNKADRSHVHFVEGNGRNGYEKGQTGVLVDTGYKSKSENFQALQQAANDHSAQATLYFYPAGTQIEGSIGVKQTDGSIALGLIQQQKEYKDTAVLGNGLYGITLFQYRGQSPGELPYAPFPLSLAETQVLLSTDSSPSELAGTVYHEMRHVVLGDFGRSELRGIHGAPGVNDATSRAEAEAKRNAGPQ